MGLDVVWQIIGWAAFVFSIPLGAIALMPDRWLDKWNKAWERHGLFTIGMPWISVLIWLILEAALVFAGWLVHHEGDWTIHPIELTLFVVMVVALNFWLFLYYSVSSVEKLPQKDVKERTFFRLEFGIAIIIFAYLAFLLSLAVFIFFLAVHVLAGFLILPVTIYMGYLFVMALMDFERNHGVLPGKYEPRRIDT